MTTVRDLLANQEAVYRFFDGQNLDDTVRLSQNAGTVDVLSDAPAAEGDSTPEGQEQHA